MQNNKHELKKVLNRLDNHCVIVKSQLPLIMLNDDIYFVERTFIELGLLKGDKNLCAHKAFQDLMTEIGFGFRVGVPNKHHYADAVASITKERFPWAVANTPAGAAYADDLPRRRAIYRTLRKLLTEAELLED